jgi:hypothetical protein
MRMCEPFPDYLLCDTLWDFKGQDTYSSQAAFEVAVLRHHQEAGEWAPDIRPEEHWQPAAVILESPRVIVRYFYDSIGEEQIWQEVELVSDNGESFTAGELLYKLHNAAIRHMSCSGHHWFEGFELETATESRVPVYSLRLGS